MSLKIAWIVIELLWRFSLGQQAFLKVFLSELLQRVCEMQESLIDRQAELEKLVL